MSDVNACTESRHERPCLTKFGFVLAIAACCARMNTRSASPISPALTRALIMAAYTYGPRVTASLSAHL